MKPPIPSRARQNVLAHVLLVAVALVWGATFPLVKSALQNVSPLLFNLLRMTLAFVALALLNRHALRRFTRRELGFGALAGLFLGLGYQFQTAGLARTSASKSAFITGLTVVLVPLFSAVPGVRRASAKRPHVAVFTGAALAFLGLLLLTTVRGAPLLSGFGLGETLTLICSFAFAAHLLTLAQAAPLIDASRLATLQVGFAALFMLFTLPLEQHVFLHVTVRVVTALLVTAVLATAAAFTIQSYAQQLLPASHVALIFTLEPVFAWLTAMLLLHERMGARSIAGALTILTGILLAELYPAPVARPLAAEALTLDL